MRNGRQIHDPANCEKHADNDGWLDIYVTSMGATGNMGVGQHRLYRNNGDLTFTNVATEAGVNHWLVNSAGIKLAMIITF